MTVSRSELLTAADILERFSTVYGVLSPEYVAWCPSDLRVEAQHLEDE